MQVTFGLGFMEDRAEDIQPFIEWLQSDATRDRLEALAVVVAE